MYAAWSGKTRRSVSAVIIGYVRAITSPHNPAIFHSGPFAVNLSLCLRDGTIGR